MNGQEKITASHLERAAFIYIRQSTLTQVLRCVPQCGGRRVPLHVPLHVDQACQ